MRFGETLSLSGIRPSVGSVGDAYDNALAETTIGLYKNECIRADSPFPRGSLNTLSDVEYITADYVAWFGSASCTASAVSHPPRPRPTNVSDQPAGSQNPEGCMKLGMVQFVRAFGVEPEHPFAGGDLDVVNVALGALPADEFVLVQLARSGTGAATALVANASRPAGE